MTARNFARCLGAGLILSLLVGVTHRAIHGQTSKTVLLARGAGATMLEGGSGPPDFMPVLTKVAFHAELVDGVVTGAFECLALAPKEAKGQASGDFSQNVMYVTGTVDTATVEGDSIRLTGNSECTGIGAGSSVPFSVVIRKGGPGATVVLRGGTPPQVFREILLDGLFEILTDK